MKNGDLIFVYGTLRPGHGANRYFANGAGEHLGQDRITGEIYNLGWFPGVKLGETNEFTSEGPTVEGDVYRIADDSLPSRLDGYEGYPSLYNRRQVTTEQGRTVWVYEYNGSPREETRISSGKWE